VGHQFFKRLAGRWMEVFYFELERDTPDLASLADAGCKVVHNRVLQISTARDLPRILAAIQSVVSPQDAAKWAGQVPLGVSSAVLAQLKRANCVYPSEASQLALQALRAISFGGANNLAGIEQAASRFFADQISLTEAVFRLPRDGLFGAQELAKNLASQILTRVSSNFQKVQVNNTDGRRKKKDRIRAPRARARRQSSKEIGDALNIAK
jgi:hypothetical protein